MATTARRANGQGDRRAGPHGSSTSVTFADGALRGRSADDGATDDPSSAGRPGICVFVRLNKDGYGADRFYVLPWPELQQRAHQSATAVLPGAPRRSRASQAGRLLPHGRSGKRSIEFSLRVENWSRGSTRSPEIFKDGSWCARRPQRAPLADQILVPALQTGGVLMATTIAGGAHDGFSRTRWLDPRLGHRDR